MKVLSLWLRDDFEATWLGKDPFTEVLALKGVTVRRVAQRRTFRFEKFGVGFFAKIHSGPGWPEIFKNLIVGKLPVLDASNEFIAARKLVDLGINTLVVAAFGVRGKNPARRQSFIVTDEIVDAISLEDFCSEWAEHSPAFGQKLTLLKDVASLARKLHVGGVVHRDFYLCHILLNRGPGNTHGSLVLIDLHRALIRKQTSYRSLVKELGALYFSSMDIGLSSRDYLRFLAIYFGLTPREVLENKNQLITAVCKRAEKLYAKRNRL